VAYTPTRSGLRARSSLGDHPAAAPGADCPGGGGGEGHLGGHVDLEDIGEAARSSSWAPRASRRGVQDHPVEAPEGLDRGPHEVLGGPAKVRKPAARAPPAAGGDYSAPRRLSRAGRPAPPRGRVGTPAGDDRPSPEEEPVTIAA
jgi:hypothetical protein